MSATTADLNIADLVTAADIRAAMADDRYWEAGNSDRESYVQMVSDAWQRLTELAEVDEERGSRTGAEPVGVPAPDVPVGRPTVIFVGGAADETLRGPVNSAWARFMDQNPSIDAHYFPHDDAPGVRALLDSLPAGTYTSLVGHSWGGDTAAEIAAAFGREGRQVDNLITIDPVRRGADAPDTNLYGSVRAGAGNWTNVNATGGSSFEWSNLIAGLGRDYGAGPERYAHSFVEAPVAHREFGAMLDRRDADGLSAMDRITRVW